MAPITIPVSAAVTGIAGAAAATTALVAAQGAAEKSTLGLKTAVDLENTAFGKQAVILEGVIAGDTALAGAQDRLSRSTARHSAVQGQFQKGIVASAASLTGLRGAVLAASTPFLAATVAVTAFGKAISLAAGLEQQLSVFRVTARATADEMEAVAEAARTLGADISLPGVSAGDAARTFTELAKAGLSVQDSLSGGRGVLQLATAAQIDFGQAAELTASALNAFQLSGDEAIHVADLLANASNEAQGSIADMGLSLQQAAAVANQVGLSLDDTVTALTLLARAGLRGSDAGTSFRVAITKLIAPTKAAQAELTRLNVALRDSAGNVRADIFAQLGEALDKVSKKQRDVANVTIFGTDGQRAAAILERTRVKALNDVTAALERQGAAQELAAARSVGLAGQASALSSNLETLGTTLGSFLLPPLEAATHSLNELVGGLNTAADSARKLVQGLKDVVPGFTFLDNIDFDGAAQGAKAIGELSQEFDDLIDKAGLAAFEFPAVGTAIANATDGAEILSHLLDTELAGKGPNEAAEAIQKLVEQLERGDPKAQALAARLEGLVRLTQALGRAPTIIEIQAAVNEGQVRAEATRAGNIVLDAFNNLFGAKTSKALGFDVMANFGAGLKEGADKQAKTLFDTAPPAKVILGPAERLLDAQLGGDQQQQLAILKAQKKTQEDRIASGELTRDERLKAKNQIERINSQIESIEMDISSAQKQSAARVAKIRTDADQAVIDAVSGAIGRQQNRILEAARTETLADDIARQKTLQQILKDKIEQVRKTVDVAKTKASEIASLRTQLIQATNTIASLEDQQRDAIKQQRENARSQRQAVLDQRLEILGLNIQAADISGNTSRQRDLLRKEIAEIERQIKGTKEKSLKRAQLRVALRQAQAELKDLIAEKKKENNALAEAEFAFLQTQTGFVSNLLGNLIPGSATAGLVGGQGAQPTTSIQGQRPAPAQGVQVAAAVSGEKGVTIGQGSEQIHWLRLIAQLLKQLNAGSDHPEAKRQRKVGSAIMDGIGGV